jgi:YjbE family integral membrane protein
LDPQVMADPEFWARWFGIVIADLLLAGDNALVIALAVRSLPRKQQFLGRVYGTLGAVLLRLLFVAIVSLLLKVPLLQLVGGLVLLWIAYKLVRSDTEDHGHVRQGTSLWQAIWIIIVADVVMSFDNVLAVAAIAHGDMLLVAFGIALTIPLVVWGSGLLARLMSRYPWIIWVGGGLLGYVAGEMCLRDELVIRTLGGFAPLLHYPLPIACALAIGLLGRWFAREARAAQEA